MAYRNAVYVAFNGCGTKCFIESDIKYYNLIKAWKENKDIDFTFSNSHETTYAVKDSSLTETLKARLKARLNNSKNLLLIVTKNTLDSSQIVKYEIETAIKLELPIILAYVEEERIKNIEERHKRALPYYLKEKVDKREIRCLYIPFKLGAIKKSINDFHIHKNYKNGNYSYQAKEKWD